MYLLFCTDFYIFGNFVFFVFLVVQYRRSVISKIKRLDTNTRDFGYIYVYLNLNLVIKAVYLGMLKIDPN